MSDSTPATECTIPQPGPSAEYESSCGLLAVAALARPDAHVNSALDYPLRSCDEETGSQLLQSRFESQHIKGGSNR